MEKTAISWSFQKIKKMKYKQDDMDSLGRWRWNRTKKNMNIVNNYPSALNVNIKAKSG